MRLELLITTPCTVCQKARQVWERVAAAQNITLNVIDIADPAGEILMTRLALKTVPAIIVDGSLEGIGVQSEEEATRILDMMKFHKA